jgi:hypothetical protein
VRRMMHSLPCADTKAQPANEWASRSAGRRHWVLLVLVWWALLPIRRVRLAGFGLRYWLRRNHPVRRGPSETICDAALKAKPWQCASGEEASRMQPNVELTGALRHAALAAGCNMYLCASRPGWHAVARPVERHVRRHLPALHTNANSGESRLRLQVGSLADMKPLLFRKRSQERGNCREGSVSTCPVDVLL